MVNRNLVTSSFRTISFAIAAILWFGTGQLLSAPIVVDTATVVVGDNDTLIVLHTVAPTSNLLLVAVQFVDNDDSAQYVEYGGIPLTRLASVVHSSGKPGQELWYLVSPPPGSATVTMRTPVGRAAKASVTAVSIQGVDTLQPIDTIITKSGKSTSGNMVIPSEAGDLVFGIVVSLAQGWPDPSLGAQKIWSTEISGEHYGQGCTKPGANSVNLGWAFTESKEWVQLGVNLNHQNVAPSLYPLSSQIIDEGEETSFTVTATDDDGSIPTLTTLTLPKEASFHDNGDGTGTFTFVSTQKSAGTYPITFIASDGILTDSATITITVVGANVTPVLSPIGAQSVVVGDTLNLIVSATDDDGTTPQLSTSVLPANALFTDLANGTGTLRFIPTLAQIGSHSVLFVASDGGLADSETVQISVLDTTQLAYVRIEYEDGTVPGDTILTTDDSLVLFCRGYAVDSALLGDVAVAWTITGPDSIIRPPAASAATATFDIVRPGWSSLVATFSAGVGDTSAIISAIAGLPDRLAISPVDYTTILHDTLNFSVQAFDRDSNATDPGNITWSLVGQIGVIDEDGIFITTDPGIGRIIAATDRSPVTDTTGSITVQSLLIQPAVLGNTTIQPGDQEQTLLVAQLGNYYQQDKTITSLTLRNVSRGDGRLDQIVECLDSIYVYLDRDLNFEVSAWDTLLAPPFTGADTIHTLACSLTVRPGEQMLLLVAGDIQIHAHDGDSLDFCLLPATDIVLSDSTIADGPDTLNSHGRRIVDGMVTRQLQIAGADRDTVAWSDGAVKLLTIAVPHNGYARDTLTALSVAEDGTSTSFDLDSLLLFVDDGDGIWDGGILDRRAAEMTNNGDWWTRSDLRIPLDSHFTRLFLLAHVSRFATRGATLALGIPQYGITVSSRNDGPIDGSLTPVDTVTILSERELHLAINPLPSAYIMWGSTSAPVLSLQMENHSGIPTLVDSLLLTLYAIDPSGATRLQLDAQFDSLLIYHDLDGNPGAIGTTDTLLAVARVGNGVAQIHTAGLVLPMGNSVTALSIVAAMSESSAKAGTTFRFGINSSGDIFCSTPILVTGQFPATNPTSFMVTGFPASALNISGAVDGELSSGQANSSILGMRIPANGYSSDTLLSIRIVNEGTLSDVGAISALKLWRDLTGNGWSVDDILLGSLANSGNEWSISGLRQAIPIGGANLVLTVSVTAGAFRAGTFAPTIPIGGISYRSGLNGPDDRSAGSEKSVLIMPADRITVIALPDVGSTLPPGAQNTPVLAFALYNGYSTGRQLTRLRLTNQTRTSGDGAWRDNLLGQVQLYHDVQASRSTTTGELLASGFFSDGSLGLDGFSLILPAESLTYLFVSSSLSERAGDHDTIVVAIVDAADIGFSSNVSLNGDIPTVLSRPPVVDGSVAAQYDLIPLPSRTLRPGDTSQVVLAFMPASNGMAEDTLTALNLIMSGSASSLSAMRLWLDLNADSTWQASDSLIGDLSYTGGVWSVSGLSLPVNMVRPCLMVTVDVSAGALSGEVLQATLPVNGCTYVSANDGPRDASISSQASLTIYASQLQVSDADMRSTYSIGESIPISLEVSNHYGTTVSGIVADLRLQGDTLAVRFDSCSSPLTLGPTSSGILTCYYTAVSSGQCSWRVRAVANSIGDSSAFISTRQVRIQHLPTAAAVELINSAPASVTQGQHNIFPLSIHVTHPDTASATAPLLVSSIRFTVRDGNGTGRQANEIFSRMALGAGFANYAVLEPVPSDSQVTLTFSTPVRVEPGSDALLALLVDIDSSSQATTFVISVEDANAIVVGDQNTGLPIQATAVSGFPMSTAVCRVDLPARYVAVSGTLVADRMANRGQDGVVALRFNVRHPGSTGSSPIQITSLRTYVVDALGNPLDARTMLDEVALRSTSTYYGQCSQIDMIANEVKLELSSPVTLGPASSRALELVCRVSPSAASSPFSLVVPDSTCFTVREFGSGAVITAATDSAVLSTSSAFPIDGGLVTVRTPAMAPNVCLTPVMPALIVAGTDSVSLISFDMVYPTCADCSPVLINGVRTLLLDHDGTPLDPQQFFDRIGVSITGQPDWYQPYVELLSGDVYFRFGEHGIQIAPGDSIRIRLIADIDGQSPRDSLMMVIEDARKILIQDLSDSTHSPGVVANSTCVLPFPMSFGPSAIIQPAGRPTVSTGDGTVIVAHRGEAAVPLFELELDYGQLQQHGNIQIRRIAGQLHSRTATGYLPVDIQTVLGNVGVWLGDSLVTMVSTNGLSDLSVSLPSPIELQSGESYRLRLTGDVLPNAALANYSLALMDSLSLDMQDPILSTEVVPQLPSGTFPLRGAEISVTGASLQESFSNFPNPFIQSDGAGTIVTYLLEEPARVSIGIYAITGDLVTEIVRDELKTAGQHQSDKWMGINDDGDAVVPGTYFCRLQVSYQSGKSETLQRKVAVIR